MTGHKDRRWLWVSSQTAARWLGEPTPVAFQQTAKIEAAWQVNRQVRGADSVWLWVENKNSKVARCTLEGLL